MSIIDIDAALSELEDRTLRFKGRDWVLPGELPGAALIPFLADDLGLAQIVADLIEADDAATEDDGWVDTLAKTVIARPNLPVQVIGALAAALNELLEYGGEGKAAEFHALKPSVPAYVAIAVNIAKTYGLGLADFFSSAGSSEADGDDSKPTSPTTTPDSTPEVSGDDQEPTDS